MNKSITRRTLIQMTGPGALGAGLLATRNLAAQAAPGREVNETINMGLVGCGGRGPYLMGIFQSFSNVEVFDLENFSPGFGSPPDSTAPPELDWDMYVGPSPSVPFNRNRYDRHYWFHDYGGGWQLDWAVHHYDIVHWAMGVDSPVAAVGHGGKYAFPKDNTQWPDTFTGMCEYPPGAVAKNGFLLTYTFRGACSHLKEQMAHGKIFYGSDAVLALDRQGYVLHEYKKGEKPVIRKRPAKISEHDAVKKHAQGFLDCIRSRKKPDADIETGHLASNPGHLMNIAYRMGRRVRWNPATEQVEGDPEANALVTKRYRSPWILPA